MLDWVKEMFEGLIKALLGSESESFGDRLHQIAVEMSTTSLPDFTRQEFRAEYAVTYAIVIFFMLIYAMTFGLKVKAKAAFDNDGLAQDAKHPFKVLAFGMYLPFIMAFAVVLLDAGRQMGLYGSTEGWQKTFDDLKAPDGDGLIDWLISRLLSTVIKWMLVLEQGAITRLIYVFVPLLLIAYALLRTRLGSWMMQFVGSVLFGLLATYPLQVLMLRLTAMVTGNNYAIGMLGAGIASAMPLIAAFMVNRRVNFSRLVGGHTKLDGGETTTVPADDRPQNVRVEEDIRVQTVGPVDVGASVTGDDFTPGMEPHVGGMTDHRVPLIDQIAYREDASQSMPQGPGAEPSDGPVPGDNTSVQDPDGESPQQTSVVDKPDRGEE